MEAVRAFGVKRGEWQDDVTHYGFHRHAVEQAADQRVLRQKSQPAAGSVINSGDRERDEEMQQDAQNVGGGASVESRLAEQACGDYERNAATEEDERL
jgi:hypothetical protein